MMMIRTSCFQNLTVYVFCVVVHCCDGSMRHIDVAVLRSLWFGTMKCVRVKVFV